MKKYAGYFVALGAISYGIPGSFFKKAGEAGVKSGTLLVIIFFLGCLVLNLLTMLLPKESRKTTDKKETLLVMMSGFAMAFSNTCYLLSLKYVSVAVTAVMMMQSVWLAIVLGAIFRKEKPNTMQVASVFVILGGTVLATGLFPMSEAPSFKGMALAFVAAFGYALTIQFTGGLGVNLHPLNKTRLMVTGAFLMILLVWGSSLLGTQNYGDGLKWGSLVAVFGLLVPLLCYSYFMPKISSGLGAILSSLELPSAVFFAFLFLREMVTLWQLVGLALIIASVVISHLFEKKITT